MNAKKNKPAKSAAEAPSAPQPSITEPCFAVGKSELSKATTQSGREEIDIQIILVSGYDEPERCTAALLMAMVCAASFKNIAVFLMMDAAELASRRPSKRIKVEPFDYIDQYIDQLFALGVKIDVCSTCIKKFCLEPNQQDYLRADAHIAGMYEYAARAKNIRTLMF